MRREHKNIEEVVPFSESLVFYAPLAQGDLSDHISGVIPTSDTDCGYLWNQSVNMYELYSNKTWGGALIYEGLNMGLQDNQDITLAIDVSEISFSGNRYASMIGCPRWNSTVTSDGTMYICHYRYNTSYTPMTDLNRYVMTFTSTGIAKWYRNGSLVLTSPNWHKRTRLFSFNQVTLCLNPNNCYKYRIYAKNARVYNRALSDSEVAIL